MRIKSDQKYFAKRIKKAWKPQKLIIAAGKLFNTTKVHIVGDDLLKAFYKLFCLRFCVLSNKWRNTV